VIKKNYSVDLWYCEASEQNSDCFDIHNEYMGGSLHVCFITE